ncbi:hypothetical protein BpHYR1_024792 [Brachionus plicatilis]|uniref:Uncharacterized protein n=1 Tax=Brachionus plicatilis TaxID=10195 RepID=A0A3M7PW94_BRAPC|nr:hypothetical protein BpHYR1_024792 [Brachionus plicatilis]
MKPLDFENKKILNFYDQLKIAANKWKHLKQEGPNSQRPYGKQTCEGGLGGRLWKHMALFKENYRNRKTCIKKIEGTERDHEVIDIIYLGNNLLEMIQETISKAKRANSEARKQFQIRMCTGNKKSDACFMCK